MKIGDKNLIFSLLVVRAKDKIFFFFLIFLASLTYILYVYHFVSSSIKTKIDVLAP
jgi:hypothetical protein